MSELPESWVETAISELGTIVSGGTPSTKVPDFWGGDIIWYSPADLTGYTAKFISRGAKNLTQEGLENSSAKLMPAGSVMFSSRAPIGYVAITSVEAATNQGFKSLVPSKEISADYVYHYLKSAKQMAEERASGTTFLELSGRAFSQLPVPVPPLNEQRRIAEKIENLFAELDKGEESLEAAKARAGLYRQSLLKHAFEGHLTADWRAANSDKLEDPETLLTRIQDERDAWMKVEFETWQVEVERWEDGGKKGPKPRRPETFKEVPPVSSKEQNLLPEIPSEWAFFRLCELASIGSGMSVSKDRKQEDPLQVPFLRVANVQRGYLDLEEIKEMAIEKSQLYGLALRPNDVLFNEGGDRDKLGRGWVWPGSIAPCITQNHVFRATPFHSSEQWSKFISYWGNSAGQQYFEKGGKQTTNLASINKTVLKAFPIPTPSAAEMVEITDRLEAKLSTLDAVEKQLEEQLARSKALRQSILKRAFAGELVDQDPNDEPASVLLERIKAEKAEAELVAKRDRKAKPVRKPKNRRPTMTDLIEVLKKVKASAVTRIRQSSKLRAAAAPGRMAADPNQSSTGTGYRGWYIVR